MKKNLRELLRKEKGFTMIEMMVVLIIIAVLVGGGARSYLGYIENARVTKAKTQLATMQAGLDAYYAEKAKYPNSEGELLNAGIKLKTPGGAWAVPIDLEPTDPWGKNYKYNVSAANKTACVVYTGHNAVQGQTNTYVAAESKNGEAQTLEVTNDITPTE